VETLTLELLLFAMAGVGLLSGGVGTNLNVTITAEPKYVEVCNHGAAISYSGDRLSNGTGRQFGRLLKCIQIRR